jgi:2-polyprenyl-3-methyl-5-hydroxy-6-metoxy-1,4-benzoquinol methylase
MQLREIIAEAMDDPTLDPALHRQALAGLARLNRLSRVADHLYVRLRRLSAQSPRPLRVIDIATGSGDLPIHWMMRARKDGFPLRVTGVDISGEAVAVAARRARQIGVQADWLVGNAIEEALPSDYDVVTCSLFLHHLQDDDIVRLLRGMRDATDSGGVIRRLLICDLVRSRLNWCAVKLGAHLVSRSPIVHLDSGLSVRAAMTRREFSDLVEAALDIKPSVQNLFPCRFICEIPVD